MGYLDEWPPGDRIIEVRAHTADNVYFNQQYVLC